MKSESIQTEEEPILAGPIQFVNLEIPVENPIENDKDQSPLIKLVKIESL